MTRIQLLSLLFAFMINGLSQADDQHMTWLDAPIANATAKPRAFFRDTQIWSPVFTTSDTVIEVCWENYNEILTLEDGQRMMEETIFYANKHWGNLLPLADTTTTIRGPSLLKFQDIGQCTCNDYCQ